jgi:type I restriction enzyme S subunit
VIDEIDQRCGVGSADQLLSVSIHRGVVPRSEMTDDLPRSGDLGHYKVVKVGDVVLNRMRAFEGGVGVAPRSGIVSPDYAVLRCTPVLRPSFAELLFRSHWFIGEMTSRVRGIGSVALGTVRTPRINVDDLRDIRIPLPDLAEQRRVEAEHQRFGEGLADMASLLHSSVQLLQEYKFALVANAVSGQMDPISVRVGRLGP